MAWQSWWTRYPISPWWQAQVPIRSCWAPPPQMCLPGCSDHGNLLSFSLQVSGRQSRRGCGTIPAVSAADGAIPMEAAAAQMGEARGSTGAVVLQKGAALDQYITGAFRDSCLLHFAELRQKDAGDLETVYFCCKETGNSTQGYKYILGFRWHHELVQVFHCWFMMMGW